MKENTLLSMSCRPYKWLSFLPFLLFTGCASVGPDFKTPESNIESEWVNYKVDDIPQGEEFQQYWWQQFNDPVLDKLIETAQENSPTLQSAGIKVVQFLAQYDIDVGNLYPQTQAIEGAVDYERLNSDLVDAIPGLDKDLFTDSLQFKASWELDVWGKYRRNIEAGNADFLASVASYDDALVTLISEVASTYITIRELEKRIEVAEDNVELQQESFRIAKVRYEAGQTSELDMRQAETQLANTQSQVPALKENLQQNKNALALLIGETPNNITPYIEHRYAELPETPDQIFAGIPRDLLRRRPDIRQAEYSAAAQSALIGVTQSQLYPSFSLSGVFGFGSSDVGNSSLSDIFQWDNRVIKGSAGFTMPIFNYGRIVNAVRVQDAVFQQAVLNYQNTVLSAQKEVEDALASYVYSQDQSYYLATASTSSKRSAELSVLQYKSGATDFTTVLTAAQARLEAEDSYVQSQSNILQGIVSVYREIGGGWELRSDKPFISPELQEEMSERTNWDEKLELKSKELLNQDESNESVDDANNNSAETERNVSW